VREVERLVKKYLEQGEKTEKKPKKEKPAHIQDLQERLASRLGTKVAIDTNKKGKKGKITIQFYSLDDFDRIIETIGVDSE
jgi:ParB family chromosome partitioning protein